MLKNTIPALYSPWFSKKILNFTLEETLATCDNCAMSEANQLAKCKSKKPKVSYQPSLKCCTYTPFMPNYLVGAILSSPEISQTLKASILKTIERRAYALPIGLVPPVPHQVEFNHRQQHEFGNRPDWLCPYYNVQDNNCGIWSQRGAVCTTFFCQSVAAQKGLEYWDRLCDYLTYVEAALMEEVLVQLDFSPRQISENLSYLNRFEATPSELKMKVLPLPLAKSLWNGYFDEQAKFYKRSYEIVQKMDKKAFSEALGEQGKILEKNVLAAQKLLESK